MVQNIWISLRKLLRSNRDLSIKSIIKNERCKNKILWIVFGVFLNENATDNQIDSHLAGSLYDMLPADPKTVNPAGEWNNLLLKVKDGKVTHTMNGAEVVSYTLWTPEWDQLVENSKFNNFPGFTEGISKEGYIGLQDHGYTVWFKNIKIRVLD
jgi:hypothetical protein